MKLKYAILDTFLIIWLAFSLIMAMIVLMLYIKTEHVKYIQDRNQEKFVEKLNRKKIIYQDTMFFNKNKNKGDVIFKITNTLSKRFKKQTFFIYHQDFTTVDSIFDFLSNINYNFNRNHIISLLTGEKLIYTTFYNIFKFKNFLLKKNYKNLTFFLHSFDFVDTIQFTLK